jgi:hypothetical protein
MPKLKNAPKCFSENVNKNMSKYYYKDLYGRNGKVIKNRAQAIAIALSKAENKCYKTARYAVVKDSYYRIIGHKFKYNGKYYDKKDPIVTKIIFKKKHKKIKID